MSSKTLTLDESDLEISELKQKCKDFERTVIDLCKEIGEVEERVIDATACPAKHVPLSFT